MSAALDQHRALLLNGDFRPLSVWPLSTLSWEEAISGVIADRLIPVSHYPIRVRSARDTFLVPSVVAAREYVNLNRPAPKTRWNLLLAHEFHCAYCPGRRRLAVEDLTFDHVVPKSRGGPSTWHNLVPACRACNEMKRDRTPDEAGLVLLSKPYHPTKARLNALAARYVHEKHRLHEHWRDYLYWDSNLDD